MWSARIAAIVFAIAGSIVPCRADSFGFDGLQVALGSYYPSMTPGNIEAFGIATVVPGEVTFPNFGEPPFATTNPPPGTRIINDSITLNGNSLRYSFGASDEGTTLSTSSFNGDSYKILSQNAAPITSVSILPGTNVLGLATPDLSFTANSIKVNFSGVTLPEQAPGSVQLSVSFGSPPPHPPAGTPAAILSNSVSLATADNDTTILATFKPNGGLTLRQAAVALGYQSFNWTQTVQKLPSNVTEPTPLVGTLAPPFPDPPPGGYVGEPYTANRFPYYWSGTQLSSGCVPTSAGTGPCNHVTGIPIETSTALLFGDAPALPQLEAGQYAQFTTNLVGILANGSSVPLYTFDWADNFDGTSGSGQISTLSSPFPVNQGSGTGGVTIISDDYLDKTAAVPEPSETSLLAIAATFGLITLFGRGLMCGQRVGSEGDQPQT